MEIYNYSPTSGSSNNNAAPPNGAPEGMEYDEVNEVFREIMASIARWRIAAFSGTLVTTGTQPAYLLTSGQSISAYAAGQQFSFTAHASATGDVTLNVDGRGASAVVDAEGTQLGAGDIISGSVYTVVRRAADFMVTSLLAQSTANLIAPSGTRMLFQQTTAPTGWTKDTTHNNKALRLVSGSVTSGGTEDFTTAFSSTRTPSGTVGNHTLTIAQIPAHGHPYVTSNTTNNDGAASGGIMHSQGSNINYAAYNGAPSQVAGQVIGGEGGGQAHNHSFTGTAMNFAVKYVDFIIAQKN